MCEHVFVLSTNQKGAIAEMKIATAAIELGVPVLRPMTERARYDLAFEISARILRVQCKWAALSGGVIKVNLESCRHTPKGYVRTSYRTSEIDAVAELKIAAEVAALGATVFAP